MCFLLAFEKPGSCPKPIGFGICVELCSGDDSCPDVQKCYSNGCGHVCMNPGTYLTSHKCTHGSEMEICVELCGGNETCPATQEYCSNGCGHVHVYPGKHNTFTGMESHFIGLITRILKKC